MKVPIVSIGYTHYVFDDTLIAGTVLKYLCNATEVDREYIDSHHVYVPKDEKSTNLELNFVPESLIRPLSKDEDENKEIASLKSTLAYRDSTLGSVRKELDCLKAQLKELTDEPTKPSKETSDAAQHS